jgi:hypothetical protein
MVTDGVVEDGTDIEPNWSKTLFCLFAKSASTPVSENSLDMTPNGDAMESLVGIIRILKNKLLLC